MQQRTLHLLLLSIGIFPFLINGLFNHFIATVPFLYWSFEFFSWIILPLGIFWLAFHYGNLSASDLGITRNLFNRPRLFFLLGFCVLYIPIDYFIYEKSFYYAGLLFSSDAYFSYQQIIPEDEIFRLLIVIYFALSAGIVEELYFRAYLYRIAQFFAQPGLFYLTLSPLLFSIIHWESGMANLMATFIFGLFSALLYLWLKNIWPFVIGHITLDLIWFSN